MEDPVTKLIPAVAVPTAVAFFAAASIDTRAEAKKYKPPKVAKNVGKSVGGRAALNTGKTIGSDKRWGVNGIWVNTGLGAGHAALTNNCTYYYKRYKETRNAKWRNKYNACIR